MKCPSCGSENETGKYCGQCGAAMTVSCAACGAPADPGARYCTACGEPVAASVREGRSRTPLYIAGAALLVTVLVLMLPDDTERAGPPPASGAAPFAGSGDGILSSDMRTNADRLFNRVMTAAEQGNEAEVNQFMPMAIQAYGMVEGLDADGLYHLAILHQTAGQHDEARATAQRVLESNANHILMLGVAAGSAAAAGDSAAAGELYRRLLDAYPSEAGRPISEYVDHNRMLSEYRTAAQSFIDGG